jgi:hypothetical protein
LTEGQLGNFHSLGRKFSSPFGVIGDTPEVAMSTFVRKKPVFVTATGMKNDIEKKNFRMTVS